MSPAPRPLPQRILGYRPAGANPAFTTGPGLPASARAALPAVLLAVLLASAGGCSREPKALGLQDLLPGERRYVERVVVLERAKAVALVDPAVGGALLDSLAAAWGDSSLQDTLAGAPTRPLRAVAVGDLLCRILAAEEDSLVLAPRPDRLASPLAAPLAEAPAAAEPDDPERE